MEFLWNCYKRAGDDGLKNITDMEQDRQYMKMALELAQKGMGFTAPNPMVGCGPGVGSSISSGDA